MLVVDDVQPGSPATPCCSRATCWCALNGQLVTGFEPLEAVLDDAVGQSIDIEVERGGKPVKAQIRVDDLDSITPAAYLEFGNAILHTLSYQMARHFHVPIKGVFVATSGYSIDAAGIPRGAVITMVNGTPVETAGRLHRRGARPARRPARATLRYFTMEDPRRNQLKSVFIDRRWFPARRCQRDDAAGLELHRTAAPAAAAAAPEAGTARYPKYADRIIERIAPSLVGINFDMPYSLSGVNERNYHGTGAHHRRRARTGAHRPQYRAGVAGRRAADLRRHAGDSRRAWSTCIRCTIWPCCSTTRS